MTGLVQVVLVLLTITFCRAANETTRLVCFGDSYSDTGGLRNLTNGAFPSPTVYPQGRLSDSLAWPDYAVQQLLDLQLANRAVAGATACPEHTLLQSLPHLRDQVLGYVQQGGADAAVFFIGLNDYWGAVEAGSLRRVLIDAACIGTSSTGIQTKPPSRL